MTSERSRVFLRLTWNPISELTFQADGGYGDILTFETDLGAIWLSKVFGLEPEESVRSLSRKTKSFRPDESLM